MRVRLQLRDFEQRQPQGFGPALVARGVRVVQQVLQFGLRLGDHVFKNQHEFVRALDAVERLLGCVGHPFINAHAGRGQRSRCYNEPNFS